MKIRVFTLAALLVGGASVVNANDLVAEPVKTVERPASTATDFATYRVVPGVRAQGSGQTGFNLNEAVQSAQAASMSGLAVSDVTRTEGNLVFNHITNDYGVLTGHISILAAEGSSVREIAQQFGLDVEMAEDRIGLGVLYAGADTDLVELAQSIRESGLARAVEIDVHEHLNQPHR